MAQPTVFNFGELLISVSNGATPPVFSEPCGLTAKAFNGAAATNDTIIPDCDDPDAPAWLGRSTSSLSRDITGSGVLAGESLELWDDWFASGLARDARITLDGGALGDWQWAGSYILSGFNI